MVLLLCQYNMASIIDIFYSKYFRHGFFFQIKYSHMPQIIEVI